MTSLTIDGVTTEIADDQAPTVSTSETVEPETAPQEPVVEEIAVETVTPLT